MHTHTLSRARAGRRCGSCFDEEEILGELPAPLRRDVLRVVGARAVGELDALRGFDDECVGFVASRLRRAVLAPGEVGG